MSSSLTGIGHGVKRPAVTETSGRNYVVSLVPINVAIGLV